MQETKLTVTQAKEKLYAELTAVTGWKFLKSQPCLKKVVKDIVFDIQFYASKYNSSESVEVNCEFRIWCKRFDKQCNVNSTIGFYSFQPPNGYWYDISTQAKLDETLAELNAQFNKYAAPLVAEFEKDYDSAIRHMGDEDMQKLYHIQHFANSLSKLQSQLCK